MNDDTHEGLTSSPNDRERHDADRYAALELVGGEVVIYDRENHRAWLQSNGAVALSTVA